jgi:hypothetical protein
VATFDSTDTAAHVYGELDGMDVEASGVVLDLRYVDDDEMFEGPVTRADRVPPNFKPLAAFKVSALTQSRFKISWDQDDAHRHYSLRDSFVGDTAESDLAAYMAHSDSDDDGDEEKHSQEKLKIRKRYAALLAEIGVSPEDADDAPNEDVSDSNDSDSDFNPVANADDASDGSMEATFDMDAGTKADQLQHGTRQRKRLADADLGERQQIRYKERRSAAKKAKKELLQNDREAEKAAAARKSSAEKEQLRQSLQAVALPDIEAPSGRAKKKLHAQQKKKLHAQEREHKKKSRLAASLGISQLNAEKKLDVPVAATTTGIDERFKQKLLTDPRFHLDVAQRDKRRKLLCRTWQPK